MVWSADQLMCARQCHLWFAGFEFVENFTYTRKTAMQGFGCLVYCSSGTGKTVSRPSFGNFIFILKTEFLRFPTNPASCESGTYVGTLIRVFWGHGTLGGAHFRSRLSFPICRMCSYIPHLVLCQLSRGSHVRVWWKMYCKKMQRKHTSEKTKLHLVPTWAIDVAALLGLLVSSGPDVFLAMFNCDDRV